MNERKMSSASVPSAVSGASDEAPPKFSAATTTTTFVNCDDGMSTKEGNGAADRDAFDKGSAVERVEPTPGDFGQRRAPWCPHPTPWADIIAQKYPGNGVEGDPFVVSYLPVGEREDPYTWGRGYKWVLTMMSATGMLAVTMGSSILSATIMSIRHAWPGHNDMMYIMVTGCYILGFVVGPFVWAPFSEVFGRRLTIIVSFIPFTAFAASVCGAPTLDAMLVLRFLAGTFGCSSMTNSGATIADMFNAHERGLAMGVFAAMPFLGPVIGPVVGGFLGPATKWEWVAAVAAFFALFITVAQMVFLPETCAVVILRKRAAALTKATGRLHLSEHDIAKPLDVRELMKRQFRVPIKLLFTEPIVFCLSLYMATAFAILYLQFTAFPIVFQQHRHWSPGIGALAFVPVAIGSNLALVYLAVYENPAYVRKHKAKGYLPPEARLRTAMIGSILLPVGLMWFAWTCVPVSIHWIVSLIAIVPYGAGTVLVFLACQNYLVDTYLPYAASVIAGGTVVRSIMGVILPLFTVDMYTNLGVNWASTLVAFIALLFTPAPFLLSFYGRKLRLMTGPGREADAIGLKIAAMAAAKRAEEAQHLGAEVAEAGALGAAAVEGELEEAEEQVAKEEKNAATASATTAAAEAKDRDSPV